MSVYAVLKTNAICFAPINVGTYVRTPQKLMIDLGKTIIYQLSMIMKLQQRILWIGMEIPDNNKELYVKRKKLYHKSHMK